MEFSWLSFVLGVVAVVMLEFFLLVGVAVSAYNKQQKAKSDLQNAVAEAVAGVTNIANASGASKK